MRYFDRDISWLAFNKRVLLESLDKSVPIYGRINFLSIFSSNLEEFYQVRVASGRDAIKDCVKSGQVEKAEKLREELTQITEEVKRQEELFRHAWEDVMLSDLKESGVEVIIDAREFEGVQKAFISRFFQEEVFPFLQPVKLSPSLVKVFVRDKRIYLGVFLRAIKDGAKAIYVIKLPFTKVPRFIELPKHNNHFVYTFVDEVVKDNLDDIFSGFKVLGAYSFKVSRDADVELEDEGGVNLAENLEGFISKRKTGAVTRFQYDYMMPYEMLQELMEGIGLKREDLLPSMRHLQLQDLKNLPNPLGREFEQQYLPPVAHYRWDMAEHKIDHVLRQDESIFVPYTSFDYLLSMLNEACSDSRIKGIKVTQYRVAESSDVIDVLIKAANSGKEVTVFVELKARFDEENNLQTAQRMIRHGIKIIYSLPGLKVHAKTCLIEFHPDAIPGKSGIACFSTGNFNEKTALFYSDVLLFTSRSELARELAELFRLLEHSHTDYKFRHLLVASHGMVEKIHELIDYEIAEAKAGRPARMILKMNALEEERVITKLYQASEAGVKIDLLIRGICRVVPNQPYSKNITITRLIDIYLEHARIWYFHHGGEELYFISSADWMRRNLYRRIESAAPIYEPKIKEYLGEVLHLALSDNVKACYVDEHLDNVPKESNNEAPLRTQVEMYKVVEHFNQLPPFIVDTPAHAKNSERVLVPKMFREPRAKASWLGRMVFGKKK